MLFMFYILHFMCFICQYVRNSFRNCRRWTREEILYQVAEGWSKKVQSEFYWNASDLSRTFMYLINGSFIINIQTFKNHTTIFISIDFLNFQKGRFPNHLLIYLNNCINCEGSKRELVPSCLCPSANGTLNIWTT